ncbi:MAG: FUSC family protein [Bacteroidetes bacterium MedPE-SWsnd-G2]|nr:MAG: FUSC family protein [Bacteroidetes bacterium MedPE-SWsnd-G2]
MRKTLIILGLICATLCVVLSVLPLYKLSFIPAVLALGFGAAAIYFSNKHHKSKKTIHLVFLLSIIGMSVSIFKTVTETSEIGDTEVLNKKVQESEEDSKEILEELDIEIE